MIDTTDPLERLRAANPVPAAAVGLIEPDAILFHRITTGATVSAGSRRTGRRPGRRLVPALVATTVLGGAVAYAVLRDNVTRPETVACYGRADLESQTEVPSIAAAGPVEACAALWRDGAFGPVTEVPPLVACVLPTGVAGVFPATAGADVCTGLNLVPVATAPPPLPTSTTPGATVTTADLGSRVIAFRDAVTAEVLGSPCVTAAAGEELVRRELQRAGLGDWSIVVNGSFTADRPCVTVAVRSEERQVVLVPAPPRR